MIRRIVALVLMMALLCAGALAEEEGSGEGEFPALNAEGFLDEGEFVYENKDEGVWRYASPTLKIEIIRYKETQPKNQIWYEAEIWSREGERFKLIPYNAEKRMKSLNWPYKVARETRTVFGINTDYAQVRMLRKQKTGVVIRDGEVYAETTRKRGAKGFPNLDVMALYPDGNMEVYYSDEKTAEEYLAMGVESTLAFGPILIRDGELNEEGLKKYGTSSAQRTAIGMVEKGHYFAMMMEGRRNDAKGAGVSFLAEKLYDRGCTVALNLDGGQTSCMVFMGHQICNIGKSAKDRVSARKTPELVGIGTSELVAEMDDPW